MARIVLHSEQRNRPARAALRPLGADRTVESLGENPVVRGLGTVAALEELDGFVEAVLDVEELAESQQLKDFIDLRLDFEKHEFAALGPYRFQKRGERSDARRRHVVQSSAVENDPGEPGVDGLGDPFLKEVGVVSIDVPREVQDDSVLYSLSPLETDLEAVVLVVIESGDDVIVSAHITSVW